MKKHMILNVYVNKSTNILAGSEIQINSSIQCFPIPQEMIFQVTKIARPTSALSPCALSKAHCRGSREMHGSRRDARLYARFAGAARYLHSSPELSRLSLRFREYSVKGRNLPIISQCERVLCKKKKQFFASHPSFGCAILRQKTYLVMCGIIILFIPSHPSGTHMAGFFFLARKNEPMFHHEKPCLYSWWFWPRPH